ncbi:MAG TPA: M20/M25/M40 family metallo-hydrolase, partial [Pyrinomonadaceae bacterium]
EEVPVGLSLGSPKLDAVVGVAIFLIMLAAAWLGIYQLNPPAIVPADAPNGEFSSARALKHVEVIAVSPRPVGSVEHAAARDYLMQQLSAAGLAPEIQRSAAVNADSYGALRGGHIENVVAKLPGTGNSRAVLLVGHYDSVPNSYGASDNGAAVGAMLETLRALKTAPPLKNDVIFLFSDGEEVGLLGAKAFVDEHPWAKDVGLVLNFEARGNSGASIMFETSSGNGWLVEQFADAAPYPVGNSLAYEVYRLLPNDTDMSVFKRAGYAGMNFAYVDGLSHYHTQLDSVSELDGRSLQHHGHSLLSLTRRFGDLDLKEVRRPNAVYFNLPGVKMVNYSGVWVLPLAALIAFVFLGLLVYGVRRKRLSVSGVVIGFLAFLASLVVSGLLVTGLWKLLALWVNRNGGAPSGETYHNTPFLLGFIALTVAITAALYVVFRRKVSLPNLMAGGLLWWLLLLVAASVLVPGASYLFAWPLLFTLAAFGFLLSRKDAEPIGAYKLQLILMLGAIPGIILLAPTIQQVFTGLTVRMAGAIMVLMVLLLALLMPHMEALAQWRRWALPAIAAIVGFGFVAAGVVSSGANARQPRQDQIFYGLNADTGKANWLTFDQAPDEWTSQYLTWRPEYQPVNDFASATTQGWFPRAAAESVQVAAPNIEVLGDASNNGTRTLRLRVTSPRQAPHLAVYVDSKAEVSGALLNGKQTASKLPYASASRANRWALQYKNAPPEGIELVLEVRASEPLKLRVVDQSAGLPAFPGASYQPRPAHLIPAPNPVNNSTLVSKSFVY